MDPLLGAHSKICKTLRKLATWNSDRHTKSIIKLLLQVLMNHWRERQGIPTAYQNRKLFQETKSYQDGVLEDEESKLNKDLESKLNVQDQTSETTREAQPKTERELQAEVAKDAEVQRQNRVQEPVENDFYDFLRLQSHFEDWDEEDTKDWNKQSHVVLSLLEMAGLTEIATERDGPLKIITSKDVKKLISALESNAFGMFDRMKKKPICFGRAIYPIASFFNHSCECNSTAVQADGSMQEGQEVTGEDVLECLGAEQANNDKNQTAPSKQPTAPSTPIVSASVSTSSSVSSLSEQTSGTGDNSKAQVDPKADDESRNAEAEPVTAAADPYDSRVGQFRMMTFFAIQDIAKGQDVTISYIDTEMPLHARRLALLSDYHFHCCCDRCLREEKMPSSSSKKASKSSDASGGGGSRGGKKGGSKADKKTRNKSK
ncbi:hypothetical protein BGX26_011069 [Mortierella sp. AD094]|nr:hypothetical protein BGX26_011069 [Mortierella sp. AD094]